MVYGRCWNSVGGIDRATGSMPKRFFWFLKRTRSRRGRRLTRRELWGQVQMVSQMAQRAILVRFLHFAKDPRLTFAHLRGMTDPPTARGGDESLVILQNPLRGAVTGPSTIHSSRSKPEVYL